MICKIQLIFLVVLLFGQSQSENNIFLNVSFETGLINLTETSDIFYWYFPSERDNSTDPLTIWLNGGPGCSSTFALFAENGPFNIKDDLTLQKNPYSWSQSSNLLYVDQPAGTGFSRAHTEDLAVSEKEIAEDFYKFFKQFLEKHPALLNREIFITGESYAGHYIPAIGKKFVQEKLNLVGVAIGNGWVDPQNQYPEYATYALENKLIGNFHSFVLKGAYWICKNMIQQKMAWLFTEQFCQLSTQSILQYSNFPQFNLYDVRVKCAKPPLCYDFNTINNFLARPDVKQIIGVGDRKWKDCNMTVHIHLLADKLRDLSGNVKFLLESGTKVLIYSGDRDFICNWRGGEAWTNNLNWHGKDQFQKADYEEWSYDGVQYGEHKSYDNLNFLRVYNAGHMVPMDQPKASLQMLNQFIHKWTQESRLTQQQIY